MTLDLYEDGDHVGDKAALHARSSAGGSIRSFDDLSQPRVRGLLRWSCWRPIGGCRIARRTCCCSPPVTCSTAGSIRGSSRIMLVSTTVDYWAGQRMEDDPAHKKRYLAGQPRREPRHARVLQVPSTSSSTTCDVVLASLGIDVGAADARDPAAGRHLVLHLPGAQLHHRHLSRRDAGAAQPDRLRAVRRVLSAPGGRTDHAGAEPAARRSSGRAASRSTPRAAARCSSPGASSRSWSSPTTSPSSPAVSSVTRIRRSSCSGPASSRSAFRSTPTSRPTPTSRAASRAGSASS